MSEGKIQRMNVNRDIHVYVVYVIAKLRNFF